MDNRFTNLTSWSDRGRYYWADLDTGPTHGPFRFMDEAQEDARRASGKPDLLLYGSCPDRFLRSDEPGPVGFTQQMAETYGDRY